MKSNAVLLITSLVALPFNAAAEGEKPSASDVDVIRRIVANLEADTPDPHVSANLDWENAFGIRYSNLKKRDAFYGAIVKPQFKTATDNTLETRVQFPTPDTAVADTYWHVAGQVYAGETKAGPDRWGRTTYIFTKVNGTWTEVIERVADLRLPYYKHFDALPAASAVPAPTLQSYSGHYAAPPDEKRLTALDISIDGDHLLAKSVRGTFIAIPTTATDFLLFYSANDVAQYMKAQFAIKDGHFELTVSEAWGEPLVTLTKQP